MKPRSSLSVILCFSVLLLFGSIAISTRDSLILRNGVTKKQYDAVFQAPGRRSLLSDAEGQHDTALVAALDGTIYLLEYGSFKPLWSFSSGPEIYSSFQAPPLNGKENASGIDSNYYIDCGDDWELYAHNSLGKLKLMKSLEEYISSTPQIAEDGGIVLGSKKTTAFLVDFNTGRIIYTYGTTDTTNQTSPSNSPYNATIAKQYESGSGLDMASRSLYITRTDYTLTSFIPNSDKVLWNMTVAEIGAASLCQDTQQSIGGVPVNLEPSERTLRHNLPLPCQSRALIYRFRNHSLLETLSMINGLPMSHHHQDMMLPAPASDVLPSQPNVEKVLNFLPYPSGGGKDSAAQVHNDVEIIRPLDPNSCMQHADVVSNNSYMTFQNKLSTSQLLLSLIVVLLSFAYGHNLLSKIRVKFATLPTDTSMIYLNSRRKKSRKSPKSGSRNRNQGKEENDVSSSRDDGNDAFYLNLSQPISRNTDGRTIGKLFVSSKEIAKGSNGTIVLEGIYEGRPVAVKRMVRAYNDVALKEIQNLIMSDRHQNIVRWYGVEQDRDFVYLALERCSCSLNDLVFMRLKSSRNSNLGKNLDEEIVLECPNPLNSVKDSGLDFELWNSDGYPSPLLLKLMRDMIAGIAHLHELGIVHRDLKPQNVLIVGEKSLCAKLSDMGISKRLVGDMSSLGNNATGCGSSGWQAPEQLLLGRQTRAVDLFSLGCVLFFCISGGRHPFGNHLERDINIIKGELDLFSVDDIPEAVDLLLRLLDPKPEMRPKALEVLNHPLFWGPDKRISFLRDTSDMVELEDRGTSCSDLLKALESTASVALGGKWNEKMEPSFLNNIGRYRRYKFDSVRDLLRVIRNKLNHYRELPAEIQEIIGPVPEGFDKYFYVRFPKLLIEVYKVMFTQCREEECFSKYFTSMDHAFTW